jgi:hypothetical protein
MPRLTQTDDILFPVEEHPVFVHIQTGSKKEMVAVPGKKAIINADTNRVLGIVSKGYKLVSNKDALDLAYQCCKATFPETKPSEWGVTASDAPGTGGHCFIDLEHNSANLDFELVSARDRPDTFGPFIRVTNSYNGLRALAFDIGFFRKVCNNGMIIPESIIRFKYNHLQRDIGNEISFNVNHGLFSNYMDNFKKYLGVLKDFKVTRSDFEPLFCGVLQIIKPKIEEPDSPLAKDWNDLSQQITTVCNQYINDLGENAYAVFNAITDFSSHPVTNRCVRRERHSFQKLAGNWINNFSQECRKPGFSITDYLARLSSKKQIDSMPAR